MAKGVLDRYGFVLRATPCWPNVPNAHSFPSVYWHGKAEAHASASQSRPGNGRWAPSRFLNSER